MCEKCRERAARIPKDVITAIEARRAELIELLAEINDAANDDINKEAMKIGATREGLAIGFAPYIAGYLIGQQRMNPQSKVMYAALISDGLQHGADLLNSENLH